MQLSELKEILKKQNEIQFKLQDGNFIAPHFHVTEVGLITKHFIDCGGTVREEKVANFQLWLADDYNHRLTSEKLLHIIDLSKNILGTDDLTIEVEYQQQTIGKFGLEYAEGNFLLTNKQTACLAPNMCGIPPKKKTDLKELATQSSCCTPGFGCC